MEKTTYQDNSCTVLFLYFFTDCKKFFQCIWFSENKICWLLLNFIWIIFDISQIEKKCFKFLKKVFLNDIFLWDCFFFVALVEIRNFQNWNCKRIKPVPNSPATPIAILVTIALHSFGLTVATALAKSCVESILSTATVILLRRVDSIWFLKRVNQGRIKKKWKVSNWGSNCSKTFGEPYFLISSIFASLTSSGSFLTQLEKIVVNSCH